LRLPTTFVLISERSFSPAGSTLVSPGDLAGGAIAISAEVSALSLR
jgi:hypothetical protein